MLSSELYKLTESNKAEVFCFEERDRTTGMTLNLPKLKRIGLKTRWNRFQVLDPKYVSPITKPVSYAFPLEETLKEEDDNENENENDEDFVEDSEVHIDYINKDNVGESDNGFFITGVNVEGGLLTSAESPTGKNLSRDDEDLVKPPEIPPGQIPISEAYKLLKKALDLGYEEVPMKKDVSRIEKLMQVASLNANVPLTHLDPEKDYLPPKLPKSKKIMKKKSDIKIMNEVIEEVDKRLNIIEFNIG
jgi:hypothetical protein